MSISRIPTSLFRAIRFQNPDKAALRKITDVEWELILRNWSAARIMTSFRLDHRDDSCSDLPDWVNQKLDQYLADTHLRFQKIKSVYATAANELEAIHADHVVIKGFSLFPGYTDHPDLRPQGDIDLYCPPDAVQRAQDRLLSLGYVPVEDQRDRFKDHLSTMMPNVAWGSGPNLFDPEMPIGFELHFCFWNEDSMRVSAPGVDQFWNRRTKQQIDDLEFSGLHPVDNLGYTSLNMLRDLLRGFGLPSAEQVYGLGRFLHTQADDDTFWQSWRELHDPSLRRLEAISFQFTANCFGCKASEEVQEEMERLPAAVRSWLHETSNSEPYSRIGQAKNGAWLHVALLESLSDKLDVLREVLLSVGTPPKGTVSEISDRSTPNSKLNRSLAHSCRELLSYPSWFVSRSGVRIAKFPSFFRLGFRLWLSSLNLGKGFWTFFAGSFFFDLGMFIFFVLYNLYLLDRGYKENVLGLVASASAIGGIVGAIPAGLFAERFGLRKALLLCLTSVSAVFALRSVVTSENLLIALAFVGGMVITIWAVCISPAVAQLTNEKSRPLGFSSIFSSGIAVGILGGQAGGRLPGWIGSLSSNATPVHTKQIALLIACALTGLGAIPISRIKFSALPAQVRKTYPSRRFIGRYLAAMAVWTLAVGAFEPFFNAYFAQHFHMALQEIGSLFSYAQLSQVLAIMASPILFRKVGVVDGVVYVQIAAAIALGALALCTRAPVAAVVYVGYTALQWMTEPGMMLLLMNRVAPEERTGASALSFLVMNIAGAVATALAGASFSKYGYPFVLMVVSIVGLVAAFTFRLVLAENERVPDASLSSRTIS
jgi:MFS family permease